MLVSVDYGTRHIQSAERWINDLLLVLVCASNRTKRDALINMLKEIADLRFGNAPPLPRSAGFYSGPLFWDPFGCGGTIIPGNVAYRISRLSDDWTWDSWKAIDPAILAQALYQFHTEFSRGCEDAHWNRTAIDVLVYTFEKQFE